MEKTEQNSEFTDLLHFKRADPSPQGFSGTVIKAGHARCSGTHTVGVVDGEPHEPTILIHRQGEEVESIEFQCKCGRSATVQIHYAEE
jgi:hypothetical protein